MVAAVDGEFVEVTYLDGSKEQVLVHQLPLRILLGDWAAESGDEAALVELYCNKEAPWRVDVLWPTAETLGFRAAIR